MKRNSRKSWTEGPVRMSTGGNAKTVGASKTNGARGRSSGSSATNTKLPTRPASQIGTKLPRSTSMVDRQRSVSSVRTPMAVRSNSANRSVEKYSNKKSILTPVRYPGSNRKTFNGDKASMRTSGRGSAIGSKSLKDTRPLTDKTWQITQVKKILDFLRDNQFRNDGLTSKNFPLSNKDFTEIFNFLYSFINPNETEVLKNSRSEESILNIMKSELGYPGTITKSNLVTMGSLHSWPTVLGCLSYLYETARMYIRIEANIIAIAFPSKDEQGFPVDRESLEKIRMEQERECYHLFLDGEDEFQEQLEMYRERLMNINDVNLDELRELDHQKKEEQKEVERLRQQPNRKKDLELELQRNENDFTSLQDYCNKLEKKRQEDLRTKDLLKGRVEVLDMQIAEKREALEKLKKSSTVSLHASVITQLEVDKRRRIQKTEEEMKILQNEIGQYEVQFYRIQNKIEKICRDFNSICMEIDLKTGEEFFNLPSVGIGMEGVVTPDPCIPDLQSYLEELLREKRAQNQLETEELDLLARSLQARQKSLKAAQDKTAASQAQFVEVDRTLIETRERVEQEEAILDRNIIDLRNQLMQLKTSGQRELEDLQTQIQRKGIELEDIKRFRAKREKNGKEFMEKAKAKALEYIESAQEILQRAEKKVTQRNRLRQLAIKKALEEAERLEAEVKQMMFSL